MKCSVLGNNSSINSALIIIVIISTSKIFSEDEFLKNIIKQLPCVQLMSAGVFCLFHPFFSLMFNNVMINSRNWMRWELWRGGDSLSQGSENFMVEVEFKLGIVCNFPKGAWKVCMN